MTAEDLPGSTRGWIRYLLSFLRPYRVRLVAILTLTIAATLLGLTYPYFLQKAVDRIFLSPGETSARLVSLRILASVVFTVSLLQLASSALGRYLYTWVAAHLLLDMREALYRHLLRLPIGFFTETRVGEVQARIGSDLAEVQSIATGALFQLVGSLLALAGALGFLLHYSVRLTIIALLFVPLALALLLLFQRRIHALAYRIRRENTGIVSDVIETFGAVKTVKAFSAEAHRLEGFRRLNLQMIGSVLRFQIAGAFAAGLPGTVLVASSVVVFLVGGSMVLEGSLTVGALIACNIYLARLLGPIQGLLGLYINVQRGRAALDRVFEFLQAGPVEPIGRGRLLTRLQEGIELRSLTFGYDRSRPLLKGLSLRIPAGTSCAVVGRSGAGKTTLLDLLAGFLAPGEGEILLDGLPMTEYDLHALRARIGMVVQGGDLFCGTLDENIRLGRREASDGEVREAVEVARLGPLIERLGGLGEMIGERGARLSAGERERVAIARAVLGNPEFLLVDEALGRLDPEGREEVLEAILRAAKGRTSFLVTHDEEVARRADLVLFLEGGGQVVAGRHAELERDVAAYRKLLRSRRGRGVRVAAIDSGINRSHPHVRRIGAGLTVRRGGQERPVSISWDGAPDTIGHGTACAGVIHEAAPGAEILPVRVFVDRLQTEPGVVAAAIREAIALGPDIIHLSLGIAEGEGAREIEALCQAAEARGIVVVASGFPGEKVAPGQVETVIGVGEDRSLGPDEVRLARHGEQVDFAASPYPREIPGAPSDVNLTGPSFAAARVAGLAARLLEEEPGLTPGKLREKLRREGAG